MLSDLVSANAKILSQSEIELQYGLKTGIRFTNDEIENSFISNHKSNVTMYMRYIQFRIVHYRIATKTELYKMKIVTEDSCEYCKQVESIEHLFYACEKSTLLWFEVQESDQ